MHYYQYRKRLLETVLPLKRQARDYYIGALSLADSLGLKGKEIDSCRNMFAYANYSIGAEYDSLDAEIVARVKDPGENLSKEEKEKIVFQLQDISYELQDKAIEVFEEGLSNVHKNNLEKSGWSQKILENLARLNPRKYGGAFYQPVTLISDSGWLVSADSVSGWNSGRPFGRVAPRAYHFPLHRKGFCRRPLLFPGRRDSRRTRLRMEKSFSGRCPACKVVADQGWGAYYHFTYGSFPKGTVVPTFTAALAAENAAELKKVNDFFANHLGEDPPAPGKGRKWPPKARRSSRDKPSASPSLPGRKRSPALA